VAVLTDHTDHDSDAPKDDANRTGQGPSEIRIIRVMMMAKTMKTKEVTPPGLSSGAD
jgi:hypothetical protein